MKKGIKRTASEIAMKKAVDYVAKEPVKNLQTIIDHLELLDHKHLYQNSYNILRTSLKDPENNWTRLLINTINDTNTEMLKKMLVNVVLNSAMYGYDIQRESREKYKCNVPWTILMDPTSDCNLKCIGCWASEYDKQSNLTYEELDRIIEEAKELGMYFFIFSGGEPLVRGKDIIRLCEKHSDCAFLAFTNGTLITEEYADEMRRVGNFTVAISVEGFEEETDMRRGKGTYKSVIKAMDILKEKKVAFGISCCYHAKNAEMMGSDEFIDYMIDKGAKYVWYFTYMPVGNDAVLELMSSAAQRKYMYDRVRYFRKTKPIFIMDFWNDGEYVGGCIAGGRSYMHITASGDVEPCAFVHYSNVNIKETSLLDALHSPIFMEYYNNQPFNDNHLRPCPLLDNKGEVVGLVKRSGAHSTDMTSPEDVEDLAKKCAKAAEEWEPVANELWECSHGCKACKASK